MTVLRYSCIEILIAVNYFLRIDYLIPSINRYIIEKNLFNASECVCVCDVYKTTQIVLIIVCWRECDIAMV